METLAVLLIKLESFASESARNKVCVHTSICCVNHIVFISSAVQQVQLEGVLQPIDQTTKAGGNVSLKQAGASNNSC